MCRKAITKVVSLVKKWQKNYQVYLHPLMTLISLPWSPIGASLSCLYMGSCQSNQSTCTYHNWKKDKCVLLATSALLSRKCRTPDKVLVFNWKILIFFLLSPQKHMAPISTELFSTKKYLCFSYFTMQTYVVGNHKSFKWIPKHMFLQKNKKYLPDTHS